MNINEVPKYYICKINDIAYIRPSTMAFYDGYNGFQDADARMFIRKYSKTWIEHLDKLYSEFETYKSTNQYAEFVEDFKNKYNQCKSYFKANLNKKEILEKDDEIGCPTSKFFRPAVYDLLKIGEMVKDKSFQDILFYDSYFYEPKFKDDEKMKLEKAIDKYVNKYGLLGILDPNHKLIVYNLEKIIEKLNWKSLLPKNFNPKYVETFLLQIQDEFTKMWACFSDKQLLFDSPHIDSSLIFSCKPSYYDFNKKKKLKNNTLRTATFKFSYIQKYKDPNELRCKYNSKDDLQCKEDDTNSYCKCRNDNTIKCKCKEDDGFWCKCRKSILSTTMSPEDYILTFFPTLAQLNMMNDFIEIQRYVFYSEPVFIFLYAAKSLYLQTMYMFQIYNYRPKNIESENATFEEDLIEILEYLITDNVLMQLELDLFPDYDVLRCLIFNDIAQKNHYIQICPLCGKVVIDLNISKGKIFCSTCAVAANLKRSRINRNKRVEIKNDANMQFRKPDKQEIQELLDFYMKNAKPIAQFEKKEIESYETKNSDIELYVAEYERNIIGLYIKGHKLKHNISECIINSSEGGLILNKDYLYTNVEHLMYNYIVEKIK